MNRLVLITGIQRSGATLVTKALNLAGAEVGQVSSMYENFALRMLINKYYERQNCCIHGHYPLPLKLKMYPFEKRIEDLINIPEDKLFAYKDSRNGQIWKVWLTMYPQAKWIIVRRRTGDIINSCMKTGYMKAYDDPNTLKQIKVQTPEQGWLWWVHQQEKNFKALIEAGVDHRVVYPERMVEGDYSQIYEVIEWLGLKWNDHIVSQIDPSLQKSRNKLKK